MSGTPRQVDRRRLIVGAGALAVIGYATIKAGWLARLRPARALNLQAIDNPAGYRKLASGAITSGLQPFLGLGDDAVPQALQDARQQVADDLCATLFKGQVTAPGTVPMAYFYDYQCPICKRLTPRLRAATGVNMVWHDLAALGPASETAARASIAARAQGAFDALHDRLMRAKFQPNESYIVTIAESIGIDTARLLADMQSASVTAQLMRSRALADLFGMPGTPGLVVGRTVVIGDISNADLAQIVALELADPGPCT